MLSKKNEENEQLKGNKNDSEMQIFELENKMQMMSMEKETCQEEVTQLRKELSDSKDEIKKKVNQLTQVNNMKKMIVDKNGQLKTLREKLSKYENIDDDAD